MGDPYEVLGVGREAKPDEIRSAYRRLAKQNHPDLHPGNKAAEARFKDVSAAYGIVGDEKKRALFDNGKIDASGAEQQRPSYREHAEAQPGFKYEQRWQHGEFSDEDLFAELFGRRGGGSGTGTARGTGVTYALSVDFLEAINGAKKRVVMADGKALDLTIPPGLNDGQTLRLRGQGPSGIGGAAAGDVLVVVHVKPHKDFRRDGNDIRSTLPVTLAQALGGAKLPVDTVAGPVNVTIPKGSNSGSVLRLRGKGVPAKGEPGNHFVELQVVLPTSPDDDFINSVVEWEKKQPYDPRKGTGAPS